MTYKYSRDNTDRLDMQLNVSMMLIIPDERGRNDQMVKCSRFKGLTVFRIFEFAGLGSGVGILCMPHDPA